VIHRIVFIGCSLNQDKVMKEMKLLLHTLMIGCPLNQDNVMEVVH